MEVFQLAAGEGEQLEVELDDQLSAGKGMLFALQAAL